MPTRERRYILRSLFSPGSVKFWKLKTDCARLVYLALLVHADDNGVVECDHESVNAIAPRNQWSVRERSGAVQALVRSGLGTTYRETGKLYMKINGFEQSQSGQVVRWERLENQQPPNPSIHSPLLTNLDSKLERQVGKEGFCDSEKPDAEKVLLEARRIFRRIIGRSIGSPGQRESEWSGLVAKEGREVVLAAIEIWARENRDFLKRPGYSFGHFMKNKSEWIEAAKTVPEPEGPKEEESEAESADPNLVYVLVAATGAKQQCTKETAEHWIKIGYARGYAD